MAKYKTCVDLTNLNKAVQQEVHPNPSVEKSLSKLGTSKIFSKLHANNAFWQILLDEESRLITTFVTPFSISSTPEIFQHTMSRILKALDQTICQMDDILFHGIDQTLMMVLS